MTAAAPCRCPSPVPFWLCEVLIVAGWDYTVIAGVEEGSAGYARLARCPCCDGIHTATVHLASGVLCCSSGACRAVERLPASSWVTEFVPQAVSWLDYAWGADGIPVCLTLAESEWALPAQLEDIVAWTKAKPGRSGVQDVGPPGTGKTKVIIDRLVRTRRGSVLAPRHDLRVEMVKRFDEAGGGDCVEFEGVIRLLKLSNPDLAKLIEAFQALGYSGTDFIDSEDRPKAVSGDGAVSFAAHHHLPHVWVEATGNESRQVEGRGKSRRKLLWTPLFLDEAPPLLNVMQIKPAQIELLTSQSSLEELNQWLQARRRAGEIIVAAMAILRARRQALPEDDTRYATYVSGDDLQALLVEAAGGEKALIAAVYATPHLAPWTLEELEDCDRGSMDVSPLGLAPVTPVFQATPIICNFPHKPAPAPPKELARSRQILPRDWPHCFNDHFTAALFSEATLTNVSCPSGHTACLVVDGRGKYISVWGELRRLWSLEVPARPSMIVADATAQFVESAFRTAWPKREIRYFRAEVLPAEPAATTYVWLKPGKTAYSRRALVWRGTKPGEDERVRPGAIPSIIRLLLTAVEQMSRRQGCGKQLAVIAPKPVARLIRASLPDDKSTACDAGKDDKKAVKPDPRLQAVLRELITSGRTGGLAVTHQGAVSGTNTLESCDALLTMPFFPNLGAVYEDARALGVDPEAYLRGLIDSEMTQESHRLRPLRATMASPKLLMHVGSSDLHDWPLDVEVVEMPAGGPVPSCDASAARFLAEQLIDRHGAVSAAFVRFIASEPDWYACAAGLTAEEAEATVLHARCSVALSKSTLGRAVKKATPTARLVKLSSPLRNGGRWVLREVEPFAAAALVRRLVETREVSDAS